MSGRRLVWEPRGDVFARRPDELAVEEPMEVRLSGPPGSVAAETLTVTMRTPGHDFELAAGWLLAEGVIDGAGDLGAIRYCTDPDLDGEQRYNIVTADLRGVPRRAAGRLVLTSSSCGICGSSSIESLQSLGHLPVEPPDAAEGAVAYASLIEMPAVLSGAQRGFRSTGGLHGAALVTFSGELLVAREDIGRHNAVDKVIGWALLEKRLPLSSAALVVSGRTSFEIVQKALRAGISFVAGISAASSLAARLADEAGMTLVGFLRGERCTVYSHPERIGPPRPAPAGDLEDHRRPRGPSAT